jgi:3-oxoacyl-[acyl-carrier-protein] synthase II
MRTAVVTGLGPVSAIGTGADAFWSALIAGRSGTRTLDRCAVPQRGCKVAAVVDDPPAAPLSAVDPKPRAVELALRAARLAWADAAMIADPERVGIVVGSGFGNLDLLELAAGATRANRRISPALAFRVFNHAAACELACDLDIRGPIATLTSGCNSGMDAIGTALDWIRLDRADVVLVGGVDSELTESMLSVMTAARALAVRHNNDPARASRPFDIERDGNVPGEGAGFVVLEAAEHAALRSARVRARLAGFAAIAVGKRRSYDPFDPVLDPTAMIRAMTTALADAGLSPSAVSSICANGSSSIHYDILEAQALHTLVGPAIPVTSIKGAIGQTGAASAALQTIAAVLSVEHSVIPPTINAESPDPRCALDLVRSPREQRQGCVLANGIGFGGYYYASIVITSAG